MKFAWKIGLSDFCFDFSQDNFWCNKHDLKPKTKTDKWIKMNELRNLRKFCFFFYIKKTKSTVDFIYPFFITKEDNEWWMDEMMYNVMGLKNWDKI